MLRRPRVRVPCLAAVTLAATATPLRLHILMAPGGGQAIRISPAG